ncbi:MAG: hypothetical protein M3R38_25395 [Actinomycetota bacterium]|nr:hypothetical protein [Actinomycetota bacterium]
MANLPGPMIRSPRDVQCPHCKAPPGSPCKRPSEHTVFGGGFHVSRKRRVGALPPPTPETSDDRQPSLFAEPQHQEGALPL